MSKEISQQESLTNPGAEEGYWQDLVENAPNILIVVGIDDDNTVQFINRCFPGQHDEKTVGCSLYSYFDRNYEKTIRHTIEYVVSTGKKGRYIISYRKPGYRMSWYLTEVGPIVRNGRVVAIALTTSDITERKMLEQRLTQYATEMESRVQLRTADLEEINASLRNEIERHEKTQKQLAESREQLEERVRERTAELVKTNEELVREVTYRERAERAAWQSHAQLAQLFYSTADGLCVIDGSYTISRINDRYPFLGDASEDSYLGSACREVFGFSICGTEDCVMKRLENGESRVEIDIVWEYEGEQKPFILTAAPVYDSAGNLTAIIETLKDMSERKELERQLVHAQKMESVGQLAAGIAHEINTPMQYLGDNTRFLKDAFDDLTDLCGKFSNLKEMATKGTVSKEMIDEIDNALEDADLEFIKDEVPQAIDQSLDGIDRVSRIVRSMKEFSHPGVESKTLFNINRGIDTTVTISRNEWKYVAEIETKLDSNLPLVPCLPGDFNQAMLNIIVNASHAIGDKAEKTGDKEKGRINITTKRDGDFAEICISDTGGGIPDSIKDRVFDPFFTTKEVGKGTGQGLSFVYSIIVDKHDGSLSFESEEGIGTTFKILLPLNANGSIDSRAP